MRTSKNISFILIAAMAVIIFAGCRKENSNAGATTNPTSTPDAGMVLTPVGYMEKSKVHFIAKGYQLSVVKGRLQKLEAKSGRTIEDFGEVKPLEDRYNLRNASHFRNSIDPAAASGWIAYGYWSNTGTAVTNFTTTWVVPSVPSNKSSQTIFLFNGMQDGLTSTSYIIQPVLQWGPSAAGGGKYWAITNWYVSSSQAFFGSLVTVSAGASLTGVMKETAVSGSNYSYNSSFTGYSSASALQVNNVPQAYWCAETLESYGVTTPSNMYPPNTDIAMKSIQILKGTTNASISWSTAQAVSGAAQKAVVVSNASPGGEVDIYFR